VHPAGPANKTSKPHPPGRNMNINSEFRLRGQRYTCVGYQNYETRDGRWLELLILESDCPDCGSSFRLLTTETNAKYRHVNRRCEDCHRPGVPVEPRHVPALAPATPRKARTLKRRTRQRLAASGGRRLRKSQTLRAQTGKMESELGRVSPPVSRSSEHS
jgi:hypothetical protein